MTILYEAIAIGGAIPRGWIIVGLASVCWSPFIALWLVF